MTRLNGNDFLACSLQLFEQKGLLRVQLNNHLPEHRPALQNCFHRTKGKGAPGGSDDQYGSNTDVAGSRLSADKAILKAVLESTMCSYAESSVPSNSSLLGLFLTDKEVEGCSPRTIAYYESTLKPYEAWMEEKTMLSEDGRIVRVDNPWCSFYIDTELAPALDESRCGKWMFYFNDIEFAEEVCRKAALGMVVAECKHSSFESVIENGRGVACFYLNLDDVEAHRRVVASMLEHGLVRKTKSGKLYNIGFKLDDQARAGEYGAGFKARITLSDRSN